MSAKDKSQQQSNQTDTNSNDNNQPQEDMISKAEFQKVQEQLNQLKETTETSQTELNKAKDELLSPEYLAFKEQQERSSNEQSNDNQQYKDLESMSRPELVNLIKNDITNVLSQFRQQHLDPMKQGLVNLMAREEVRRARDTYDDFDEYKDDILKIVGNNDNLTIDEAYKQARGDKTYQKSLEQKEKEAKAAREKPGGPSSTSTQPKDFDDKDAAAEDAWAKAVGNKDSL